MKILEKFLSKDKKSKFPITENIDIEIDIKKESINNIIFIYEPVFSIGTGNALDKNEIIDKIKLIKNIIFKKYDEEFNNLTLGYGGSINSNNIFDIVNNDEINAILVGSSSLNEKEFANIINLSS